MCVPAFNRAKYIGETIRSVLAQTLQSFELIIYDDASTDGTAQIVAGFTDDRIRYSRQPHNVGIAENRTSCVGLARGEFIAWLDADDLYFPDALETQTRILDAHPSVGLVHGAYDVIDYAGRKLPDWPQPFSEDTVEPARKALGELLMSNYIRSPTVMVRRSCHVQAGPYSRQLRNSSEDWEMWMRIASRSDLAYTTRRITRYRFHASSASGTTTLSGVRLKQDIAVIREFFRREISLLPEEKRPLHRRAMAALAAKALLQAGDAFTLGRRWQAIGHVITAVRLFPRLWSASACLLLLDLAAAKEYHAYRRSKTLLQQLHLELAGSRFAERIAKVATVLPEWERTLADIASKIRRVVPPSAAIAVIDKWDPTILHLSRRKGWHFPDRKLLPTGYPVDSAEAIRHLEAIAARGARYLVVPSAAFWWLEFYDEFRQHLDARHQRLIADPNCIIYRLAPGLNGGQFARLPEAG